MNGGGDVDEAYRNSRQCGYCGRDSKSYADTVVKEKIFFPSEEDLLVENTIILHLQPRFRHPSFDT